MPPTPVWMTLTRTSGCWIFASSADERLDRALHVALEDDVQLLDGAFLHLLEERLERDAALGALGKLLAAKPLGALLGEVLRLALMLDDAAQLAGRRRAIEAEDLHRIARAGLLDLLAAIVVERAHLAGSVARDDRVTDTERATLNQHRRDRTAPDVEARLDDRPGGGRLRVRAQVELRVGDEQDAVEEVVEVRLLLRGHLGELRRPAPLLGLQALGGQLALDLVGVGVGDVDLVHRDDDRHVGGAGVRDRLARLRHHAVVRRDDEDGDVRHLRATGAHGGERLVTRGVEEGDLASVDVCLVGADVLGDASGLGGDHGGRADRIEQRGLAVIDVTHDRDHRRSGREVLLAVVHDLRFVVVGGVLDHDLALDLAGDQHDLLVGE